MYTQILTNVLKELMNVMNTVTIPLVVILVTVLELAINFTVMDCGVMVSRFQKLR